MPSRAGDGPCVAAIDRWLCGVAGTFGPTAGVARTYGRVRAVRFARRLAAAHDTRGARSGAKTSWEGTKTTGSGEAKPRTPATPPCQPHRGAVGAQPT